MSARAEAAPRRPRRSRAAPPRPRPSAQTTERPHARARASGRAASLPTYILVAVVGAMLFAIVTLQIQALRANMEAGRLDRDRRAMLVDNQNLTAAIAKALPRSKVEAFAARQGMVQPPPSAIHQLKLR
jgi:hypothetical protein